MLNNFDIPWVLISLIIAGLLIIGLLIFLLTNKKYKKRPTDYRALFVMGIIWIGAGASLGISTKNWGLFIMGIMFFIIGLVNRDKWEKPTKWSDLPPQQQKFKIIIMVILGILVLAGLLMSFWIN